MMNEQRIKDMWEEATVTTWPRPGKFTAGEYDYHLKKFAELIVRECANIVEAQTECLCDDKDFWSEHDYGYEMAVNDSVEKIKEHFGVE